ncbi:MAG TPA: 2-oxoacid:ferredoxin oxidoreductase subunit beta, partial [Nitrososphaeraceae archaeon]|nr:2-oxoacid:ferredoxin oxidoreductase subunit beta [Nitrososphaeraceae archaeon]
RHLKDLIIKAIKHKGLAFIDVLQPCPTYNDINTREWFQGIDDNVQASEKPIPRIYKLENSGYDGELKEQDQYPEIASRIIEKSNEWGDKIPIGIFYKNENIPSYNERISVKIDNYLKYPPAKQEITSDNNKTNSNIHEILKSFKVGT